MYLRLQKHCITHGHHDRLVNLTNVCVIQPARQDRKRREDLSWVALANTESFNVVKPFSFFTSLELPSFIEVLALARKAFSEDPSIPTLIRRDKICHIQPGDVGDHDRSKTSFYTLDGLIVCTPLHFDDASAILLSQKVH